MRPTIVLLLALGVGAQAAVPGAGSGRIVVTRVRCAVSADGAREAWIGGREGLVIHGWLEEGGTPLPLGAGAWPRFARDGRLVFETDSDDGHLLLGSRVWVLDPGEVTPRPPRRGEDLPGWTPPPAEAVDGSAVKICIDAGHGGSDAGAVGNGLLEKDVNLDVALRFADLLADDTADPSGGGSWVVLLTRADDSFVSLQQRVTMANAFGAASFCSIHSNAFSDPTANGTETYSFAEGTTAAALRDRVHARMLAAWGLFDRGTKTAAFYVLVNTTMPAELAEMGFITNPGDALLLGDPNARQVMALAHLFAVQEHHGFGVYDPGAGTPPGGGTLKGILYDAALGSGAPIAGGTVALADGTFDVTDPNGSFAFVLPAGTYAFAATAPGFAPASASETVTLGDVWESVGLPGTNAPTLAVTVNGADLDVDLLGDPFGPAWFLVSTLPGIPLVGLGAKGTLWPDANSLSVLPFGALDAAGSLHLDVTLPSFPGVNLHLQAFVPHGGVPRLTNGAAVPLP